MFQMYLNVEPFDLRSTLARNDISGRIFASKLLIQVSIVVCVNKNM